MKKSRFIMAAAVLAAASAVWASGCFVSSHMVALFQKYRVIS